MAKIDEIKEYLTTLRVFFTVSVAVMIAIAGGIISSYRHENFDVIYYLGILSEIILMISVVLLIKKIKSKTKEIGEL
jgi:hypothetical protein